MVLCRLSPVVVACFEQFSHNIPRPDHTWVSGISPHRVFSLCRRRALPLETRSRRRMMRGMA